LGQGCVDTRMNRSRPLHAWITLGLALAVGCCGACGGKPAQEQTPSPPTQAQPGAGEPRPEPHPAVAVAPAAHQLSEKDALNARDDLPADERALMMVDGAERWVNAQAVVSVGYTLVDLRDNWTPLIFNEEQTPEGQPLPNRYRRVFIGLANDQLDSDGEPLKPDEKNYLELYGVFPSLSVLRARFVQDAAQHCHDPESVAVLEAVQTVSYVAPRDVKRDEKKIAALQVELEEARRRAGQPSLEVLAASDPESAAKLKLVTKRAAEKVAMAAVEKRLTCERLLLAQSKHIPGIYDVPIQLAVRRFQQKHMIYEENFLRRKTVEALARPLLDNDYDALVRAVRERVVSAAGIIEDGTGGTQKAPGPNLVDEYTQITLQQLGLVDAASALAFFERHPPEHFKTLRAAIKLPPRPDYYAPHMELSMVVDRGDIWYDLPFNAEGNFRYQPRRKYPILTLYLNRDGKKVALARWRTTIGGWRAEQASDGYEYFRYKESDVGPRILRQIVSGPVWVAPESTPIRSLVKSKTINGRWTRIVNYDELGPGYLSAYGLVAGYFVIQGLNGRPDFDKGIRAHGSSNYLSIYSGNGYSHGCHRLPNHIAIRLYSFILGHRTRRVAGDQPLNLTRQFLKDEEVYEIKIPSRGYAYVLDPPMHVEVLEGTIRGAQQTPILEYVPQPNEEYPGPPPPVPGGPEAKSGGGEG
jgi:hypothetical protein